MLLAWPNLILAKFEQSEKEKLPTTNEIPVIDIEYIMDLINFLFAFVFIISIIGFMFSGLKFLISGGSQGTVDSANNLWKASLIGLVVSLVGYIIIHIVKIIFL